jgi:hypothetical protein
LWTGASAVNRTNHGNDATYTQHRRPGLTESPRTHPGNGLAHAHGGEPDITIEIDGSTPYFDISALISLDISRKRIQ